MNGARVTVNSKQGDGFILVESGGAGDFSVGRGERKTMLILGGVGTVRFRLAGEGAELTLLGVVVGRGDEELRSEVEVIHERPGTKAEVILKGVAFDEAKVNIKGWVKINKGAKGAEDLLREDVLLMGEGARGETYPYLEIEENDVVAKHAATVGTVDEGQLFYVMSRGLEEDKARRLLVRGFLAGVLERVPEVGRGKIESKLAKMLGEGGVYGNLDENLQRR